MQKDQFTIIYNPNNYLLRHELWVKGVRPYFREEDGDVIQRPTARRINAYKSEEKASLAKKYYESIQEFKGESV